MVDVIAEANERASIIQVCRWVGLDVPEGVSEGYSIKLRCPFGGLSHSDGGRAASFRIYPDTNSAYCFACRKYFSPVYLYSEAFEKTLQSAALDLLERVGWKPVSLAHRWQASMTPETTIDHSMLGLALRTYCARVCLSWEYLQLVPEVAELLGRCLALLEQVNTSEDAEKWLSTCKTVMGRKFEALTSDTEIQQES